MPDERQLAHGRPRKRFGQHFLNDRRALERIVAALRPEAEDTVVEIGPGRGALTDLLASRVARLVAIEVDRDLVAALRGRYASRPTVEIVEGDVLEIDLESLVQPPYLLIGNVPYYITSPILFRALQSPRPRRAVFLVQREVAERVTAPPGSKTYGAMSVNVQGFADAEIVSHVRAGAFTPPPRVDSAILRLTPLEQPVIGAELEGEFRRTVIGVFGLRRKQMGRVVRTLFSLGEEDARALLGSAGIPVTVRPENLTPFDFARLVAARAQGTSTQSFDPIVGG